MRYFLICLFTALGVTAATPVELGKVEWDRKLEPSLEKAAKDGKPIFLLFQELPGWGTCKRFGQTPLSHPFVVDATKDVFHAVAIANNQQGYDRKILKMFKERTWNNPVVRFIKADKSDIIPKIVYNRKTKTLSTKNVVNKMIAALEASKKEVPAYLELLSQDLNDEAKKSEDLKELAKSPYKHLPLGYAQAKAIDSALAKKENPENLLAPSQLSYLKAIQKHKSKDWPVLIGKDLIEAWTEFVKFHKYEVEAI